MKKIMVIFYLMLLMFGFVGMANAILYDRGSGLIYDDVLDVTWFRDASYALINPGERSGSEIDAIGQMRYSTALSWIADLNYYEERGYSDWRLPSMDVNGDGIIWEEDVTQSSEVETRDNEYAYMFYYNLGGGYGMDYTGNWTAGTIELHNIQSAYWSSTENGLHSFDFSDGENQTPGPVWQSVWAVRDGDVLSVPEPSIVTLMGVGLLGLGIARRRHKI